MIATLPLFNEWWDTRQISSDKAKEYHRKTYARVKETFFTYRQVLILNGLRRVGKTTIMYQLIEELIRQNTDPLRILYFSFDETIEDPITVLEEYSKITKIDWRKEKIYLFLDEIQKLEQWSAKVKILYDTFPNLRLCLSGSASLMISKEAIHNLVGRYFSEELHSLTLQEFAELYYGKKIDNVNLYESELRRIFEEYIRRPFPEIVRWEDKTKVNQYLRELVAEKIVKSDIPKTFKKAHISLLSTLTEIFMKDAGMILEATSLSKELGVRKLTLLEHINYLEFGNLITLVKNFRPSIRSESRKMKKIYPIHISLSLCFYPQLSEGQIFESLVCSALNLKRYWRKDGKEVDFLITDPEILPIEVKMKEKIDLNDIRHLLYFMKKFRLPKALLIYAGKEDTLSIDGKTVVLFPIHKLLFDFSLPQ